MRWGALIIIVVLGGVSCSRDLTLPPSPGPGQVSGRVLYAVPGRAEKRPAVGAVVTLVGSSLSATANAGGTFVLATERTEGLLLFQFDADGDGTVDQQLVLQLADYGTGPGKRVSLGDVLVGENAAVHGRVLRGELGAQRSGHGGSAVFVPEGPFSAFTADDGTFTLPNLPSGPLTFMVFRAGYTAVSLGTISLRPGEDFALRDVVLELSTEPQVPGSLSGTLAFVPDAVGAGDTQVVALAPGQQPLPATLTTERSWSLAMAPPGLYVVTASRTGYSPARAANVLVLPAQQTLVSTITLTDVPIADAGLPPPEPDAGFVDAGAPDAGCGGAGCRRCTLNADCSSTEWCDDGICARQCASTNECTNGRACDPATRTCVKSCAAGCSGTEVCDTAADTCRVACDVSFPCATGFKCDPQNRCVPECTVNGDCGQPSLTCQAGQCVPNSVCASDVECTRDRFCLVGSCVPRPTTADDAGVYSCSTPCQCRESEWCVTGTCQADPLTPTAFFKADAGGDGSSSRAPSRDLAGFLLDAGPGVFALRAGDRFFSEGAFELGVSGQSLLGGYTECAPGRWVRDPARRTTLEVSDGGVVLDVSTPTFSQLQDMRVFSVELAARQTCQDGMLRAYNVLRLETRNVRGAFGSESCGGAGTPSLIACTTCDEAVVSDTRLAPTPNPQSGTLAGVVLTYGSASISGTVIEAQPNTLPGFTAVLYYSPSGPVVISDTVQPRLHAPNVAGVYVANCSASALTIQRSQVSWPTSTGGGVFYGVYVGTCADARLVDNRVDGAGLAGTVHTTSIGLWTSSVAGAMRRNTVLLPEGLGASTVTGLRADYAVGALAIDDNAVLGGTAPAVFGVEMYGSSSGPVTLHRNRVEVGPATTTTGLSAASITASAALVLEDNEFIALGQPNCLASEATALSLSNTAGRIERNRLFSERGPGGQALAVYAGSDVELISNHLWSGLGACASFHTRGVLLSGAANLVLRGNTIDPRGEPTQPGPTRGIECIYSPGTILAQNNLIGGGSAADHLALDDSLTGYGCFSSGTFQSNYFWYEHPSAELDGGDFLGQVVAADAGELDSNGNRFNFNVSCFAADSGVRSDGGTARPYQLAAGSPCVDTGMALTRSDTSPVDTDLDGRGRRDAGAGPDIGCSERR